MLTSVRQMEGLPVIWQDKQMGYVERCIIDDDARRMRGFIIRKGLGAAKWVPRENVNVVGKRCILLQSKPEALPKSPFSQLKLAYLTTGERIGPITDILLYRSSLSLMALEISPGTLARLWGQSAYAREYRVLEEGLRQGHAMVTELETWTQLETALRKEEVL